jgi:hypothetical protein
MIDVLLRAVPGKARTSRERVQADDVYKAGTSLRVRSLLGSRKLSLTPISRFLLREKPHPTPTRMGNTRALALTVFLGTLSDGAVLCPLPIPTLTLKEHGDGTRDLLLVTHSVETGTCQ